MKKVILTLAFIFMLGYEGNVHAQDRASSDGFFKSNYEMYREEDQDWGNMPLLPQTHGYLSDYTAAESVPVGSSLLILGTLGVAYVAFKKKD